MASPTRQEFIEQVVQLVSTKFPLVKVQRNDREFSLRLNGFWTSLENLYRAAIRRPEQVNDCIEQWMLELLRAAERTPDASAPFDEVRKRILPMVLSSANPTPPASMVIEPLVEGLSVAYAIDSERSIAYIHPKLFESWKISIDLLHQTALDNLDQRSQALVAHAAEDADGKVNMILIQVLDGYDASRLLLRNLHDRLREHLGSPFLAGIPNRDILICFRDDEDTRKRIGTQIVHDFNTMPHQVSDRIFLLTADGIAPYTAGTL